MLPISELFSLLFVNEKAVYPGKGKNKRQCCNATSVLTSASFVLPAVTTVLPW